MRVITVSTVPVELYKILKFEGLVGSGAEAKAVVAEGQVKVNGDVETRKRKKILDGDLIEFGTEKLRIVLDETPQEN
jgi:ribosome-associated protein